MYHENTRYVKIILENNPLKTADFRRFSSLFSGLGTGPVAGV